MHLVRATPGAAAEVALGKGVEAYLEWWDRHPGNQRAFFLGGGPATWAVQAVSRSRKA
jgi:hypothetical protein